MEYQDLLDSLVAVMDDAKHEANVMLSAGHPAETVLLDYLNSLQGARELAELHHPKRRGRGTH